MHSERAIKKCLKPESQAESQLSFYQQIMNYQDTIDFLFHSLPVYQRQGKSAYKANLDNTLALDKFLQSPHTHFKSIHIAGTNGKGSVSHMLASVFQAAGYKVGLYTSPHLVDFRERIKVNGKKVSKDFVMGFVSRIKPQIEALQPSFFEMTVAMAFQYFKEEKVDIAIIETGLGGRLDSTNIIKPLVSVITNIGLDHTQFLGNSIPEIAAEKAGIIKPGIPVVIGETNSESKLIFETFAQKNSADIYFADQIFTVRKQEITNNTNYILVDKDRKSREYSIDLLGNYQRLNLITCLTAINVVKDAFKGINELSIYKGLNNVARSTGLRGRWETIQEKPRVICDTAHNKEGVKPILEQLTSLGHSSLHIIWGMVDDKSAKDILALLPKNASYYFTQANIPRARNAKELADEAKAIGLSGDSYPTVGLAYKTALKNALPDDLIFVGGSTFVVGDLLLHIG